MNMVILMGRLTADPVITSYGDFDKIEFTLAVDRSYTNRDGSKTTDFISCKLTDNGPQKKKSAFYRNYIKKGIGVVIKGSWQIDVYDKDNIRHYYNYCAVESVKFCLSNNKNTTETQINPNNTNNYNPNSNNYNVNSYNPTPNNYNSTPSNYNNNYNSNNYNSKPSNYNTQESSPVVTPGKKSSWQENIPEQTTMENTNEVNNDIIPQAFDIGIDMSDEFMF